MSKHELIELGRIIHFSSGGFYWVKDFTDKEVTLADLTEYGTQYPRTVTLPHDILKRLPFKAIGYVN